MFVQIDSNCFNDERINIYVDTETRVMYCAYSTSAFHNLAASFIVLVDENGKPKLYNGDLENS